MGATAGLGLIIVYRVRFLLELGKHLETVVGKDRPGTYLVGIRRLDRSSNRDWIRVQVSDLNLTVVEEPERVRFVVTSLATGDPVIGADIRLEGRRFGIWDTLFSGTTDAQGHLPWEDLGAERSRHPLP